jgi:hypothetical protein
MEANEFIFLLGSRPVLAPCISLVQYNPSFVDKLLGMLDARRFSVTVMDLSS